jgi:hypothetical protein
LRRARSASRSKPSPRAVPGRGKSAEAVDETETGSANFLVQTRSVSSAKRTSGRVWGNGRFPQRTTTPVGEAGPVEGIWGTRRLLQRATTPRPPGSSPDGGALASGSASPPSFDRSRRHLVHLGVRARPLHLGSAARRRRQHGDGARTGALVVRRDLPVRPPPRRRRGRLDRHARVSRLGERGDQQPGEFSSERLLEALARGRARRGSSGQGGAVLEQELVSSSPGRERRIVHDLLGIGVTWVGTIPGTDVKPPLGRCRGAALSHVTYDRSR